MKWIRGLNGLDEIRDRNTTKDVLLLGEMARIVNEIITEEAYA